MDGSDSQIRQLMID